MPERPDLVSFTAIRIADLESTDSQSINLPLAGVDRQLNITRHSLRSPDFQVLVVGSDGTHAVIPPPPIRTYRGVIADDPGSEVVATIIDGGLHALIRTSTGETFLVDPVKDAANRAERDLHVIYRDLDARAANATCGVDASLRLHRESPGGEPEGGGGGGGLTQIAFDTDVEFFQQNGSSVANTVADVEMVLNKVAAIYANSVGICYALTTIIIRTAEPDPYTTSSAGGVLCEFRNHWNTTYPGVTRDVAHLMTGRDLDENIIGMAWVGVVCNEPADTCMSDANIAYGLSESRFSENDAFPTPTPLNFRIGVTAHELGHNWNADHCDGDACPPCMGSDCDCSSCPDTPNCGIMNSGINGSLVFEPCSQGVISAFRNTRTCLGTCFVFVNWQNTGFEDGSAAHPFNTIGEGIGNASVGGTVIINAGSYPETFVTSRTLTLSAAGGAVTIGS
jgi:hypothetical protein